MGLLVPAILLTAWEAAVWLGLLSARYFPPPTAIAATFVDLIAGGVLWKEALVTLARLGAAFLLAAGPAVALGLAMGLWRPVRSAVEPYVSLLYPLPKIALLPLLLIVLGVGETAFVVTGAITAFFQIVLSTAGGVQSLDPRLIEVGTQLRRAGRGPLPQDHPAGRPARHLHGAHGSDSGSPSSPSSSSSSSPPRAGSVISCFARGRCCSPRRCSPPSSSSD